MDQNQIIGQNLKRIRTERELSLGQLAALCDLSKVVLSQIERGEANPTINTIWKIAGGLKVPYTQLLEDQTPEINVINQGNAPVQMELDGAYRSYTYYTSAGERPFDWFVVQLAPGTSHESLGHLAGSQEYLYVTEGRLLLETQQGEFVLYKGDSYHFDGKQRHVYRNDGDEELVCISIITY